MIVSIYEPGTGKIMSGDFPFSLEIDVYGPSRQFLQWTMRESVFRWYSGPRRYEVEVKPSPAPEPVEVCPACGRDE